MSSIRLGSSGNELGQPSIAMPKILRERGLSAYEISFGQGVRMTDKTAKLIGEEAQKYGIQISVHAPYYINLANNVNYDKNYQYIKRSLQILKILGGDRLVIHTGSQMEMERSVALNNCRNNLQKVINQLTADNITDYLLCIETMGKYRQIGNADEICELCSVDRRVIPTFDFGHINCLMQGKMDIPQIFAKAEKLLGKEKLNKIHIHLSYIEFGKAGEIRHTTFADTKWAFDIKSLFDEIKARGLNPTVICESSNQMVADAESLHHQFLR
jgi:deoxyribonuclease-4